MDSDSKTQLWHTAVAGFESARDVKVLPELHRSRRLHGHSFLAKVRAKIPHGWAPFPGGETDALREALAACVARFDYRYLNDILPVPTDENLARLIRSQLNVPGIQTVGVQCTSDSGVDLDEKNKAHVWRRYRFESAHRLPNVHAQHKCGRVHGHGFEVLIHADQDVAEGDLSIDYDHLDALWAPINGMLDRTYLNDIPGLENPTSELIARWIWEQLKPSLAQLSWVTVYETASCGAQYDGQRFRIWKEMTLDSAVQLRSAPAGDRRQQIHGHTFTLRLHLDSDLDQIMGWTVDFGDVKELFDPLFKSLDHHPLHDISDLPDCDSASIARLIRARAEGCLPALGRIDLYETRGSGAILSWSEWGPSLPI